MRRAEGVLAAAWCDMLSKECDVFLQVSAEFEMRVEICRPLMLNSSGLEATMEMAKAMVRSVGSPASLATISAVILSFTA